MAIYALGDVHGYRGTLERLLERLGLDESRDHLWMVGDLVNNGPDSLGVLRWARQTSERLGERFVCVLGNQDFNLLAVAEGLRQPTDDLQPILDADDGPRLLDWLRARPFLHRRTVASPRGELDTVLVHAGLPPAWSIDDAERAAARLGERLRGKHASQLLRGHRALAEGSKKERELGRALYSTTHLRTCQADGTPCSHKGPPEKAPAGCMPWFEVPEAAWRRSRVRIVFGHWAALGLRLPPEGRGEGEGEEARVFGIDSAVAFGGPLTALRLDDETVVQVPGAKK